MTTTTTAMVAALIGVASGADAAIWGMYKDSAHEGFGWLRFLRSIAVGGAAALCLECLSQLDLSRPGTVLLLFGLAYAVERLLVESWKTFVRDEDQAKYAIPMQLTLLGQPITNRTVRISAGVVYLGLLFGAVIFLSRASLDQRARWQVAAIAFLAGTVIAVGGAWKDAPVEGFEPLKFLRSPLLTTLSAWLLAPVAPHALLAIVASAGYERAASENYKTFFLPSRPRGKFAGKPVTHPEMLHARTRFVPAYVTIRIVLAWFVLQACITQDACHVNFGPCVVAAPDPQSSMRR